MRRRFNRNAVCSSENYSASRNAHLSFLRERHSHFSGFMVSGEIAFDMPTVDDGKFQPKFRTIRIFGKEMRITSEEYNTHYAKCNF